VLGVDPALISGMTSPLAIYYQGVTIVRYVASKAMFNHKKFKQRKYDYFFPIHVIHVTVLAKKTRKFSDAGVRKE
jgi:hypothetical protein